MKTTSRIRSLPFWFIGLALTAGSATATSIQVPLNVTHSMFAAGAGLVSYTTLVSGTQITMTVGNDTPGRNPVIGVSAAGTEVGVNSNNEANAPTYTINSNRGNKEWVQFDISAPSGSGRAITMMDFFRIQTSSNSGAGSLHGADVTVTNLSDGASTQFYVDDNVPHTFPTLASIPSLSPGSTGLRLTIRNANDVQINWQTFQIIPEPSRAILLLGGFASMLLRRRRQG